MYKNLWAGQYKAIADDPLSNTAQGKLSQKLNTVIKD